MFNVALMPNIYKQVWSYDWDDLFSDVGGFMVRTKVNPKCNFGCVNSMHLKGPTSGMEPHHIL